MKVKAGAHASITVTVMFVDMRVGTVPYDVVLLLISHTHVSSL